MAIEKLNLLAKQDDIANILPAVVIRKGYAGIVTRRMGAVEKAPANMAEADIVCCPEQYSKALEMNGVPNPTLRTGVVKSPDQFVDSIPDGWGTSFILDCETVGVLGKMMLAANCGSVKFEAVETGKGIPFTCHDMDTGEVVIAGLVSPYKPKNDPPVGDIVRKFFSLFRL